MTSWVCKFDRLLVLTALLLSGLQPAAGQEPSQYPRGPMRVSGAVETPVVRTATLSSSPSYRSPSRIDRRQPTRLAQLNQGFDSGQSFSQPNLTPIPQDSFGPSSLGQQPWDSPPDLTSPPIVTPQPSLGPQPPGFTPQYAPQPNGVPNYGTNNGTQYGVAPNTISPNAFPGQRYQPSLNQPGQGQPYLNQPYLNQPYPGQTNLAQPSQGFVDARTFGNGDLFRTPYDEVSPFGRQPLTPYAQTDFNDDVVEADLVVGLTPSRRTLNYGAGIGFNSDLGLFGQFIYDDRDFDCRAFPWLNPPVPFRGGGQRLRLEAMPGAQAQRYMASFTEPYFMNLRGQPVAFNVSGFYFDRDYFDWDERRFGGRLGLSYYLSQALLLSVKGRIENVDISNPRLLVPELQRSLGTSELFGASVTLAYDTRDSPYAPSQGSYLAATYEHVFGTFDYPRGTVHFKNYSTLWQRPDYSGRHILGLHFDGGITGSQTPIFENFFAGGVSTLRGFRYRHASPKDQGVIVGGELSLLGSVEYFFPVTADDMVRGVFFSDFGSLSETTNLNSEDFRLSVGGGLRLIVPALGPAPLAIDAAVPLIRQDGDRVQTIAFLISVGR